VREAFPTATGVALRTDGDRFTGWAAVYFPSAEVARETAERGMEVDGRPIWLEWGGVCSTFF